MIKKILTYRLTFLQKTLFCLGLFIALGTTTAFAQFAVSEDFRGAGNPDIIIGDDAILTSGNADPVNGGWLRLTSATTYKKGHAYVNKSFPSSLGVLVDFEFKMWRNVNGDGADGIGVFLFDGTTTPFTLGGFGGSLGYAPNGGAGLKGGYVGIGLDAYGNNSNPTEGRVGGPGVRANAVVLRGPTTTNAGTTNRFLAGTTIGINAGVFTYGDVNTTTNNDRSQNILDYNTVVSARPTDDTYYRRIQLEIERLTTGGQYKITVRWKTKITDVAFTDIASYITTDIPPALLKIGFGAATGGDLNFHEIRNLLVTTPNNMRVKKTANKDFLRTVSDDDDNLITYKIEVTNDTAFDVPSIDFVDRITDADGNLIPKYNGFNNGFQIVSANATGFTSGTPTISLLSNTITGTFSMTANSTGIITVVGRLRGYTPSGSVVINTATATPPYDEDLNNNTSVVTTPVLAEGVDIVPMYTVDDNCADGSNTFTINVSNNGVSPASVGNGSGNRKLRLTIRVPRNNNGYSNTLPENTSSSAPAGWTLISVGNTSGQTRTYIFESNQTATMASGSAYNYPFVFTENKSGIDGGYTTVASIEYLNNGGSNIEPTSATYNNSASIDIVPIPVAPTANDVYYCQGETPNALTATKSGSSNSLKWYFSASGGFSSDYAPTPTTESGGVQSYWVSQTNGSCEGPRKQINVYVTPTPNAGSIAANQYFCSGGGTPAKLTNVTNGSVVAASGITQAMSYKWQVSTDNATWTDIANSNSNEYQPTAITVTTYYRRITLSTNTTNGGSYICQSAATNVVTVAVSAIPTPGTISAAQTICYNSAPAQLVTGGTAPTGTGTLTYKWEYSPNNAAPWTNAGVTTENYTPGQLTSNMYFRRTTIATNGTAVCTSSASSSILITVTGQVTPGTITSDQAICNGAKPSDLTGPAATVSPAGGTITYRWESSLNGINGWSNAAGTAIGTPVGISFSPSAITVNTYYHRVAILTQGGKVCETYSNNVLVSIQTPQPGTIGSDQTICKNTAPALLNSITGGAGTGPGTVTYQWYSSDNGISNWNSVGSTGTGESYQPGNLSSNVYYYRITKSATNGTNCQSIPSNIIKITPVDAPQPGSIGNNNQTICNGGTPTTISSSNDGSMQGTGNLTYQWEKTTTPSDALSWTLISTATSSTYTPPAGLTQTTYYRRYTVANYTTSTCRSSSPSNTATVNVSQVPTSGTITGDAIVCKGSTNSIQINEQTPGAGSSGPSYLWQSSPDNLPTSTWTNLSGVNPTYQINPPFNVTMYYRRIAVTNWNGAVCYAPLPSNVVTITVPAVPTSGSIGSDQTICANTAPALLTSLTPGVGGSSYQWQSSDDGNNNWTNILNATEDSYQPGVLPSTIYYRRLTINNTCPSVATSKVKITVTGSVTAGNVAAGQTICSGTKPNDLTSTNAGSTNNYLWYSSPDDVTWSSTGVTTAGYTFPGVLTQTTYYRRATISGTCQAYTPSIKITVVTAPTGGSVDKNQTICYNSTPAPLISTLPGTGTGGFTYRWEYTTNLSGTWNIVSGTFNAADYSPGILNQTTYYRRVTIPTTGSCVAYSNTITITVLVQTNAGSLTANQTICMDTRPGIIGSNTAPSGSGTLTYRWESSPNGITGWTVIAGETLETYTPPAIHTTTYYRRTTISTTTVGINSVICESETTTPITVTTKNCKVITNPMIYQKVKS